MSLTSIAMAAGAKKVERLPLPDGNEFPISSAVTVRAGVDTYFLSGDLAPVTNKNVPKGSVAAYGDMQTQTVMGGDPAKDNKMDFAGMMAGYKQFFGSAEQPNKPARSAFQVAALAAPGALLEIEVIAVRSR